MVERVEGGVEERRHQDVGVEVVGGDHTRTQLEEHQPAVGGGLHVQLVVDLDELYSLDQLCMGREDQAAAVVQETVELLGAHDVGHGTIADRVAKVIANRGKNKVLSRVSRHGIAVKRVSV